MDLRQLECFLRLYEEGSVTRAARRLNIVQPALSMRIARLEEELGERLFERTPQGMRPTPSGHRAYEVFSPVLAGFRDAQRSFASRGEAGGGHLTAGFVASVADSVLARSLARFIARFPAVEVTALEGYSSTLVDWVRAGLLDFAVVNDIVDDTELQTVPLLDEPFLLIAGAASPLPKGPVAPQALEGLRLVLPTKRHGLRLSIDRAVERERLSLSVRLEVDATSTIGHLLAEPGWFTILPTTALSGELASGKLRASHLAMPHLRRRLVCTHSARRPLTPVGHRFTEALRDGLRQQAELLLRGASKRKPATTP